MIKPKFPGRRFLLAEIRRIRGVAADTAGGGGVVVGRTTQIHYAHRHVKCGVGDRDYEAFFVALMWSLNVFLDRLFSPDVREALTSSYAFMSGIMQNRIDWRKSAELEIIDAA